MKIENRKKFIHSLLIITVIFFLDRFSKNYILSILEVNGSVDIFLTKYLNIYLIWNEGIAFGLLSFDQSSIYSMITMLITIITIVVLVLIIKTKDKLAEFLLSEIPIFETLLVRDKNRLIKLLSKLKKTKKIVDKNKKYKNK